MASGVDSTTAIFDQLHMSNMTVVNWTWQIVIFIAQIVKYKDWFSGFGYVKKILSYLALQGWSDIDFANVFHLLSTIN